MPVQKQKKYEKVKQRICLGLELKLVASNNFLKKRQFFLLISIQYVRFIILKVMVFTERTILYHKSAKNQTREAIVQRVKNRDSSTQNFS